MFGITPVDNFDRYIEQRLHDFFDEPASNKQVSKPFKSTHIKPQLALDISELDNAYVIQADLPGIAKEDISVNLEDNVLTVETERRDQRDENNGTIHLTERFYGKMKRSVRLPAQVDPEKTEATLDNGVLKLRVAKSEAAEKRKCIAIR
ncbi:Alpha crystallin/Hsp20 domain-containing protein [Rozella allomycis CSF55]|uniref:Alpha crystallin/Hsp20 domain-containing protein n=1 Tax=Rozella allomycis (strain CSF55) TaxID=988480 RepID=A0A075AQE5_ROZAC|nr:Alpha crystallin/Hsp20 domain-containing protein [Rozella allomycis CSF55]|eukprot:EPZ32380.1 Alpha crystallin/Hsp20 domain-containing protein [Rozella allomycis CSF55]